MVLHCVNWKRFAKDIIIMMSSARERVKDGGVDLSLSDVTPTSTLHLLNCSDQRATVNKQSLERLTRATCIQTGKCEKRRDKRLGCVRSHAWLNPEPS